MASKTGDANPMDGDTYSSGGSGGVSVKALLQNLNVSVLADLTNLLCASSGSSPSRTSGGGGSALDLSTILGVVGGGKSNNSLITLKVLANLLGSGGQSDPLVNIKVIADLLNSPILLSIGNLLSGNRSGNDPVSSLQFILQFLGCSTSKPPGGSSPGCSCCGS